MLYESNILSLLNEVLGQNAHIRKGDEAVYFCPFCNHYKRKLEINLSGGNWHCWVCESRGKSYISFLRKIKAHRKYIEQCYTITGTKPRRRQKKEEKETYVTLPAEFIPLWIPSTRSKYAHALNYLKNRKVTPYDILRYNIGYCEDGDYRNRIVIPSYDSKGQLNFFTSRAFYDVPNPHKGPSVPKNFVGFECFINWMHPVTVVEGAFDAIAIRKNAIPLFGKVFPDKLMERLVENHVGRVNMVLDNDAIKTAIRHTEELKKYGITVHLVRLDGKDPSKLGFDKINELIRESQPMTFRDLVYSKLYE